MAQEKQKPHEIKLGRIKAVIWKNVTPEGEAWYSVSFFRLYKDGDKWKESAAFRRDELPIVAKVADMAYAWIWGQGTPSESDEAAA